MTEASAFILGDCVDRLEIVGAQLLTNSGIKLEIKGIPIASEMLKALSKRQVDADAEERRKSSGAYTPRRKTQAINKRPGRCVCICTAKGKIIYTEKWPKGGKDT